MPNPASSRLAIGFSCGILASVIWGVQAVVSRQSVTDGLSAGDVTILRFLAASLVLLPFALKRLKPFPVGRLGWTRALILTALVGPSYSLFLVGGAHFAPALHSSVITPGLIPVATALIAVLVLGDRISPLRVIGLAVIVAGVVVFSFEAMANTPTREGAWIGDLLFVLIALLWSTFGLLARRWGADAVEVTMATCLLSVPLLPLLALVQPIHLLQVSLQAVALQAFYQGVMVGAGALFLYTQAVATLGAGRAALFLPLVPVVTALAGAILLGEQASTLEIAGMALAVVGMVVALKAPSSA
ncbi:DMT family transporter [Bosea sp. (in: a-proteobacteria)]|uniref:DMT family transporter n=1 Tax=Bosea sp. (in: a-proteobacteria) TaxID=1871050 RepID=UPI002DDD2B34|nr:DMT family transporter [Bosea sp. (in: a-proteobacteria)]HEV2510156.1 DMT family transporter [Bosea sp. (in: a-proteobacteria)]